jgi:polysaccharide pyruvyl transferase WcaK-like protein/MoaA/NifB/PqqE/SkfB family radical SAM enzyme
MCHIWKQKLGYQISPEELDTALDNPLYSDVRTVGVNGGEPTLRKDLPELVEILFRRLPSLETISLITNALVPKKVIQRIGDTGEVIRRFGGKYDVMVSLDGVGEVHDIVRGRPGNFEKALKVLDYIENTDLVTRIRLGCTVIKSNVYGLHDLHDFAGQRGFYIKYRIGIPHQRLYTQDISEPFAFSYEEKVHFCIFLENLIRHYETSANQRFFYQSLIGQVMHGEPRKAGCAWQHRGATITSRGELLYCAVKSKVLGSAITDNSEKLYFSNSDHLAEIVSKDCADCTHDYAGLPPGNVYLKALLEEGAHALGISPGYLAGNRLPLPLKRLGQQWRFTGRLRKFGINRSRASPAEHLLQRQDTGSRRVMICGWYGTETTGDKAILAGVVAALRHSLGEVTISLASLEPYISRLTVSQMPELHDTRVYSIQDSLSEVENMDLVVFGGGPVMAVKNLADMLAIFEKAAARGVPTLLAGCGVGPLGGRFHNKMIGRLLQLSSKRIYRDQRSKEYAGGLGIDTAHDLVAEDPAFTWIADKERSSAPDENDSGEDARRILLGLRDWPSNQYAPGLSVRDARSIKDRFEQQLIEGLSDITRENSSTTIIPFPMCTNHFGGDDRWYYRDLFARYPALRNSLDYSVLSRELSPNETLETFAKADVALTMRFHSLVFAAGMKIPAVACDYTLGRGKVAELAKTANIPCRPLDAVDAGFISTSIRDALARREQTGKIPDCSRPGLRDAVTTVLNELG